jgi:CHAT domain-containing protein
LHDVPSGAVLALAASRPASHGHEWLLVADPQPRPRAAAALAALPAASREIAAAAAVAPADAVTRLTGARASEPAFRARLADARIVHIAAHAVVPERETANAFLAFGRDRTVKSEEGDGRVTAAEIYDMPVGADLVVLSACRSGRGRITGDGVAGFTRAFISAGARTVVASLWDAPDETARRLMARFYRQFAQGQATTEALRAAQLALLADLRAGKVSVKSPAGDVVLPAHPALWAGFRVHGLP